MERSNTGVIIGAGPAGLSAAETLSKSNRHFTVLEASDHIGGLSATIKHNQFYFDLGGHRFFTKNPEIERYVTNLLGDDQIFVDRSSKILLRGKFFEYPLRPINAIFGLGIPVATQIILSYTRERFVFNRSAPKNLEEWIISQFGTTLYKLFFKTYTEKVWGIPCDRISAQWGVQRIKGLSLRTAIIDAFWEKRKKDAASLVKHFSYPRMGIGVICDKLAATIRAPNRLCLNAPVKDIFHNGEHITAIGYGSGEDVNKIECDFVISSMPITDFITSLRPPPPGEVLNAAKCLTYRDLVCVALMFTVPRVTDQTWIYIHDPHIDFGRLHEPKNWSQHMAPREQSCIVFEYFCNEGDTIWNASDEELFKKTKQDFNKSHIAPSVANKVCDYKVVRVAKAYPRYEIGFSQHLLKIRNYLTRFKNLQLVGRYGTYKYNNLDHSIETGIKGAENILGAHHDTFMVNIEDEYLEEIKT